MRKKYQVILIASILLLLGAGSFLLKHKGEPCEVIGDGSIRITLFYSDTCSVCAQAKSFLDELPDKYPEVALEKCPISERSIIKKWLGFYEQYEVPQESFGMVPAIFTPDKYFIGFDDKTAQEIEDCIIACQDLSANGQDDSSLKKEDNIVKLPFIGEVDTAQHSLLGLAVMLGFFDGFNVCSLGALVLILGLVLFLRDRKKVLLFGSVFILATAAAYGLLIALWYHIFALLTAYLKTMEILIGLLGVGGGIYFLKEFIKYKKQGPTCETDAGKGVVKRFSAKVKQSIEQGGKVLPIILSILLFAVVITVVEFPCSAAVPLFFASRLAEANLPSLQYILHIVIFIAFYMFDEIIVFLIAVFTMTVRLTSKKFTTYLALIEAIVLFLLGLYYLFGFLIF